MDHPIRRLIGGAEARHSRAMETDATLEDLVEHLRANADTDVQFAQRVAMACCALIEFKVDAIAAIRTTFRIQ